MGCCFSADADKSIVYEVKLDANGIAHRVPEGDGTHYIHVSSDGADTRLEAKPGFNPSETMSEKVDSLVRPDPVHAYPAQTAPSLSPPPARPKKTRIEPIILDSSWTEKPPAVPIIPLTHHRAAQY